MRIKIVWILAGAACVIVVAGVTFLWWRAGSGLGISVGLPVAATVIAPIVVWILGAPPLHAGQSTPEQLQAAAQVLVSQELHQWRKGAEAEPALSGGADTLDVPWMESEVDFDVVKDTSTIVKLADSLRTNQSHRLIVVGRVGSGKTTLAQLLIAELIKNVRPGDPVPLFLPLSAWNPDLESLFDWMERRIDEDYPQLRDRSSYGPTAIPGLAERRMILPVLDGLDVLSKECRYSTLTSIDLALQGQFVVTCRDEEFAEIPDALPLPDTSVVRPGSVSREEMLRFLQQVTDKPLRWVKVAGQLDKNPGLAKALSEPRTIYLASVVYRAAASNPGELMEVAKKSHSAGVEEYLLRKLIPALADTNNKSASGYPWYSDRLQQWLSFLADSRNGVIDRDTNDIAWWRLYRAVPHLSRLQFPLRAMVVGTTAWLVIALLKKGASNYTQLTGLAYASAIVAACLFLSPRRNQNGLRPFCRPAWRWWIHQVFSRSWRVIAAGVTASIGFGFFIGLRIASTGHLGTAIRTGAADGVVVGIVVMLSAVISGIPRPLWADSRVDAGSTIRPRATPIGAALTLGVTFGLLAGILAIVKHQQATSPSLKQGLVYGVIIGLDFGVGTWLVRRTEVHFDLRNAAEPLAALRAERTVALLVPAILGVTFASAFGLSATLHWYPDSGLANGLVGIIVGSLASDWPIYIAAVAFLALTGKLPIRISKFLQFCQDNGIFRPVLQSYQFREDPRLIGLDVEPGEGRRDIS